MSIVSNRNTPFRSLVFAAARYCDDRKKVGIASNNTMTREKILIAMLLLAFLSIACANNNAST